MDEFENRLKRDAEDIRAAVSPELRTRIDASLRATKQIRPVPDAGPRISRPGHQSLVGQQPDRAGYSNYRDCAD